MKYILFSHTGSGNHGCEAIVRSTAKLMARRVELYSTNLAEDAEINLGEIVNLHDDCHVKLKRYSLKYCLAALQEKLQNRTLIHTRFTRSALLNAVSKGDCCLSIGGDNYCYNGVEVYSDLNILMKRKGAYTVLWGCSIDQECLSRSVVEDLKRYDLITVREQLTYRLLKNAGLKNLKKVSDPAFVLDAKEVELPSGFVPGKTIGINFSPLVYDYASNADVVRESYYALIDEIIKTTDDTIALIPHVIKNGNDDLAVLEPIYERYMNSGRVILVDTLNCEQLKFIISKCRLLIAARTHASIAAYSSCVPTLVIGYSTKSRGIATDLFGTDKNYVLPVQSIFHKDELLNAFHWLVYNEVQIRNHLLAVMPSYVDDSWKAVDYLNDLIKGESIE